MALRHTSVPERRRHFGRLSWPAGESIRVADIHAHIDHLEGYSAHADQSGLLDWLFWNFDGKWNASATTIFVQHGEDEQRKSLADAAKNEADRLGMNVQVITPEAPESWYDLDSGGVAIEEAQRKVKLLAELERLKRELATEDQLS